VFDFELALPFFAPALATAATPIPEGARWITVHPNGEGSKGTAVLVQEQKKGAGLWHVIGGAGGSLNYLKIWGVKSEADYKKEAADLSGAKRAEMKANDDRDKETGLSGDKRQARDKLRSQVIDAEKEFVQTVAQAQGWKREELVQKHPAGLSLKGQKFVDKSDHRDLLKRATA
jgi:hypothetical protein